MAKQEERGELPEAEVAWATRGLNGRTGRRGVFGQR